MPAGLGLRYAFLGALETSYLNANGKFSAWGTSFKKEIGHAMIAKTVTNTQVAWAAHQAPRL